MSQISTLDQIRSMKGRGQATSPVRLKPGQVFRVDGVKYLVTAKPVQTVSGSARIAAYSEDNQHDMLFLSVTETVRVLGTIEDPR